MKFVMKVIDSENPVGTNRIKHIHTCINLLPFPMSQMYFYFIFFEVIKLFQKPLMPITNTMKRTEVVNVLVWLGCSKLCIKRQLLHKTCPFLLKRGKQYSSQNFYIKCIQALFSKIKWRCEGNMEKHHSKCKLLKTFLLLLKCSFNSYYIMLRIYIWSWIE